MFIFVTDNLGMGENVVWCMCGGLENSLDVKPYRPSISSIHVKHHIIVKWMFSLTDFSL